jgi:hypothetical protein
MKRVVKIKREMIVQPLSKDEQKSFNEVCANLKVTIGDIIMTIVKSNDRSEDKVKDILEVISERYVERKVSLKPKSRFLCKEIPADLKLPPQAKIILDQLPNEGEGLTFAEWVAKVEGKIQTRQPLERVVMFYKTRLNSDNLLQVL